MKSKPHSVIVVSDLHCGCRMGLYPDRPLQLDGGVMVGPSVLQQKMHRLWREFWDGWVPEATKGEPWILVVNGDALDGVHHNAKTQMSQNLADQQKIAREMLAPIIERAAAYYHIAGTEAHVGASAENEEKLAAALGAKPDSTGRHARWELWLELAGHLCHFTHHVGTTSSSAYESTAVYKEMVEGFVDAGRWGNHPPQVIVRSHRHRHFETRIQTANGLGCAVVTPGWQLKTPFTYRLAGARACQPQVGGILVRVGDRMLYTDSKVWSLDRPATEVYP